VTVGTRNGNRLDDRGPPRTTEIGESVRSRSMILRIIVILRSSVVGPRSPCAQINDPTRTFAKNRHTAHRHPEAWFPLQEGRREKSKRRGPAADRGIKNSTGMDRCLDQCCSRWRPASNWQRRRRSIAVSVSCESCSPPGSPEVSTIDQVC
jgi:hypothetical protein